MNFSTPEVALEASLGYIATMCPNCKGSLGLHESVSEKGEGQGRQKGKERRESRAQADTRADTRVVQTEVSTTTAAQQPLRSWGWGMGGGGSQLTADQRL